MDTGSEMRLVVEQTLLEVIDRLFEFLKLLELAADVEMSLEVTLFLHVVWVCHKNLEPLLKCL